MALTQKIITVVAISAWCVFGADLLAQTDDPIALPFFDDFSYTADVPDQSLWDNSGVRISNTLPDSPPSIGVAVFDALDGNGNFYPSQYGVNYANADTLTSKPLDLYYPGDNTIYLSFFYQAGGFGDVPEPDDVLMLDFYSPEDDEWTTVETISGGKKQNFKQMIIPITQKCYLQKGFKFRFRNNFSLGSSKQADLVSNCDFWLVDYIKLDKLRNAIDTVYQDIALTNCPEIKFSGYMNVPWRHYTKAKNDIKVSYSIFYRNNDNQPRMLDSIKLMLNANGGSDTLMLGSYNLPSYWSFSESKEFKYTFKSDNEVSVDYLAGIKLVSDVSTEDFAPNNIYFSPKTFADYYARDDGSAEAGYGLHGEGSTGGMVAVKYHTFVNDNINGVYIYFNQTFNDRQADFFNLKIWDYRDGLPGNELYTGYNLALPKDKCGEFVFFPLDHGVAVSDTFFIGWQKVQNEILNVGFDKSTSGAPFNYYNINGQWKRSTEKGQIMIRPAFGSSSTPVDDFDADFQLDNNISIYPNPAKDYIRISGLDINQPLRAVIRSVSGAIVMQTVLQNNDCSIDVSSLLPGTYFITIEGKNKIAKFLKMN